MSNNLYRRTLEAYFEDRARRGTPLPGVRGRVNYTGVAIETGIPRSRFQAGSELRTLVDTMVDKLGISKPPHTQHPRRALNLERETAVTTYRELKIKGKTRLQERNYSNKSLSSYVSHLNGFMRQVNRVDENSTEAEFGIHFDSQLIAFLQATGKGKSAASALRFWATIHEELQHSQLLPLDFAAALTHLVTESDLPLIDIIQAAGIRNTESLTGWMRGEQKPTNPDLIAELETVLGVSAGTLSSKVNFRKMRGMTAIPRDWWPQKWSRISSTWQSRHDKVLSLIPEHLLSAPIDLIKPAFEEAVRKVLNRECEPPFRRNLARLKEKRYELNYRAWPENLKGEFADLKKYKTAPNSLANKKRGKRWGEETAIMVLAQLEHFFGFLCLPVDDPDSEMRGWGVAPEDITLAWLAVQDAVENYFDFRRLRSGAYNTDTVTLGGIWGSLLQPESGWLWLRLDLSPKLPKQQQQVINLHGGWQTHCENVCVDLRRTVRGLQEAGLIKQTRETMLLIKPILDHPEPLSVIDDALAVHKRDLELRGRTGELFSTNLAAQWRNHLLISLLSRFPLRIKQIALLTYRNDGTGHLSYCSDKGWQLKIPYSEFKNGGNSKIFIPQNHEQVVTLKFANLEPLKYLIPLLEFYLEKAYPVIVGNGDFLFPTKDGTSIRVAAYPLIKSWTHEYLSQYSSRRLGMKGVFPFGPHAFRDIVATHVIKTTGSISLAANILLDSEEIVREHYARFMPDDRISLAMAGLPTY